MANNKMDNKLEWYDNGFVITNIIIGLILLIFVLSQSFAISNNMGTIDIFKNIINHNIIYLLMLIYFISLKFKFGKKYFDYFNIFLIFLYFISTLTSLLTIFQAFNLSTLLELGLNVLIFCYLFHSCLRSTKLWKEFKLDKSPLNELDNEWYFIAITVVSIGLFTVGLISMVSIAGAVLLFLDCLFNILFARYIFLYRDYLDSKIQNMKNNSSWKEIDAISKKVDEIKEKVEDFVDDSGIDEKIKDVKEKINDFVEENEIDEKIDDVKDEIVNTAKKVSKKAKKGDK